MQKYFSALLNVKGEPIAGATIVVTDYVSGALASLYEDDETTAKTNPLTSDSRGEFSFNVSNGTYNLTITKDGTTRVITKLVMSDLSAVTSFVLTLTNDQGSALARGKVAYGSGNNLVKLATSLLAPTTLETSKLYLVADATVADGAAGRVIAEGVLGGLVGGVAGTLGYLAQDGTITATVPSTGAGDVYLVTLGYWKSATEFYFDPKQPILL